MDDSISRRAAIDALMQILDRPNHAEFLYTDEICKVLNDLPSAQPVQRWIPCSERLPEDDRYVLITHRLYGVELGWHIKDNSKRPGWHGESEYYEDDDVVAWMELPKAYCEADMREENNG